MSQPPQPRIQCSACRQQFPAAVQNFIDTEVYPQGKALLLAGRLNAFRCPQCGTVNNVVVPILYHDPSRELLITLVPMELNITKDQQEQLIGNMLNELTRRISKDNFKGYMFQPRRAITMQGLIEQVLEADGVTREMMDAQRQRADLAQRFVQASHEEIATLIQEHDAEIDTQFIQMLTVMAQRMLEDGQEQAAQHIIHVQAQIVENSSFGQQLQQQQAAQEAAIQAVSADLETLGEAPQRSDFADLVIHYTDEDEKLQALVGLVRPVFDYLFFQEFTTRISQAPAAERDKLENVRNRLLELTTLIDQQQQAILQEAAGLLQEMLTTPDLDAMIAENLPYIDNMFMSVLTANIQEAQRRQDLNASARLKQIYDRVVEALRSQMQPELRFINDLIGAPDEDTVRKMVAEHANEHGDVLFDVIDAVEQIIASQGGAEARGRLNFIREEIGQMLG